MRSFVLWISLSLLTASVLWAGDHSEYIQGPFENPQQVTEACLACHEDAATEVMASAHWTWLSDQPVLVPGHEQALMLGKKNLFNNFCISLSSNWARCTSCHIGYGWKDDSFDFTDQKNVDCLVCHDNTNTYKKKPTGAGFPEDNVDLLYVAKNVGQSTRSNCGNCHFYGGGGENVKHGDLEPGLNMPDNKLDVHMGKLGMNCQDCHKVESHVMKGIAISVSSQADDRQVECTDCHESNPHNSEILNTHYEKVACQTCHIPEYAKELPTKVYWDWSTSGSDREIPKDKFGKPTYDKKKGDFRWDKNIQPEYFWYNGNTERYLLGDKVNSEGVTHLNYPLGDKNDPNAKIYPFKVHRGKQISDKQNGYLIVPKLFGGFWKHYDWNIASKDGMETVGLAYSGKYEFVETDMFWRVNHEISEKEQALKCLDCHGENSRLDWEALGYSENPVSEDEVRELMGSH